MNFVFHHIVNRVCMCVRVRAEEVAASDFEWKFSKQGKRECSFSVFLFDAPKIYNSVYTRGVRCLTLTTTTL